MTGSGSVHIAPPGTIYPCECGQSARGVVDAKVRVVCFADMCSQKIKENVGPNK